MNVRDLRCARGSAAMTSAPCEIALGLNLPAGEHQRGVLHRARIDLVDPSVREIDLRAPLRESERVLADLALGRESTRLRVARNGGGGVGRRM
jgi:hypothetical protein